MALVCNNNNNIIEIFIIHNNKANFCMVILEKVRLKGTRWKRFGSQKEELLNKLIIRLKLTTVMIVYCIVELAPKLAC